MIVPDLIQPLLALAILAFLFLAFAWEKYPPDVVAIAAVAVMLTLGLLSTEDFISVFANGAPVAIGALFVLSGALIRTGALDRAGEMVTEHGAKSPIRTLAVTGALVLLASAFLNNTPVVMVMIPVVLQLATAANWPASRMLIPLSYAAILGGGCTLIGTSTNLLVDGVARANGLEPFSVFEIASVGVGVALIGTLFMALAAPLLLPNRKTLAEFAASSSRRTRFFTEVVIPIDSPLIGEKPREVDIFSRGDTKVIDVLRGDASLRRDFGAVTLAAGDRVVLRISAEKVVDLRERGLTLAGTVDTVSSTDAVTVEALVPPGSKLVGKMLGRLRFRRRYGVYPIAVHRRGEAAGQSEETRQLDNVRLQVGDTLLLEGPHDDIHRLIEEAGFIDLTREAVSKPARRSHAPMAIGVMLAVVLVAGIGLMPIAGAATIGVAAVLLLGVIDPDEAFSYIDARLLALIVSMLAIGLALQNTGAISLIVGHMVALLDGVGPFAALIALFVLTSVLTEVVTNNAVAVVVTPLAIGLAQTLGYDPRSFVVAVMVAANTSFATPVSYQTNMLVYAPGGYRFTDYLRLGLPLKLVSGAAALWLLSLFWPIEPL